jgi:hypothetical protein
LGKRRWELADKGYGKAGIKDGAGDDEVI